MIRKHLHGYREFIIIFLMSLNRHKKRGNRAIPPLGIRMSWNLARCALQISTGCVWYAPRWMRGPSMTIDEAAQIAGDVLPEKVLALHVKDEQSKVVVYMVLTGVIFCSANGISIPEDLTKFIS